MNQDHSKLDLAWSASDVVPETAVVTKNALLGLAIGLGCLALFGLVYLWQNPVRPRVVTPAQVPNREITELVSKLANEQTLLARLSAELNRLTSAGTPGPSGADSDLSEAEIQLRELSAQVAAIRSDTATAEQNAQAYQQNLRLQQIGNEMSTQQQIQILDRNLVALQNQMAAVRQGTPDVDQPSALQNVESQIAVQEALREQLRAQIRVGELSVESRSIAAVQRLQSESRDVYAERSALESQIAAVRLRIATLRQAVATEHTALETHDLRVRDLRDQISSREKMISDLSRTIASRRQTQ